MESVSGMSGAGFADRSCAHKGSSVSSSPHRLLTRSERLMPSASAIRLTVGSVGECQPRSISPRYLASMRGMRCATWSSVSPRPSRASRIASPSLRDTGSARVRLGKDHRRVAGHIPASLRVRHPAEHSTCSPLLGRLGLCPPGGSRPRRSPRGLSYPVSAGCGACTGRLEARRVRLRRRRGGGSACRV